MASPSTRLAKIRKHLVCCAPTLSLPLLHATNASDSLFNLSLDELLDVETVSTAAGYSQSLADAVSGVINLVSHAPGDAPSGAVLRKGSFEF